MSVIDSWAMNFWTIFAAVLGANILTVCFVWSGIHVAKREINREPLGIYLVGMLMPLLFLGAGLYSALGYGQ
jgi:hypothetical protein